MDKFKDKRGCELEQWPCLDCIGVVMIDEYLIFQASALYAIQPVAYDKGCKGLKLDLPRLRD